MTKRTQGSLTAAGFAVEDARGGDEAVVEITQRSFDLVLLDINVPGLSGFQACSRIRALAPRTGIVMVTVRDAEDDKVRGLESGANDYITKPFRLRELVARLRAVLRRIRLEDSAQPVLQACDLEIDLDRRLLRRLASRSIFRRKNSTSWRTS